MRALVATEHVHAIRAAAIAVAIAVSVTACGGSKAPAHAPTPDLGAIPLANFARVNEGIYRGGHPDSAGLDYLKRLGIKTIVDLEVGDLIEATPEEIAAEEAGAQASAIDLVRFPMSAFEFGRSERFDHEVDRILLTLSDPARLPIYVHCKHGQDRTGLVIGLERVIGEHWKSDDAHAEMISHGFHTMFLGLGAYYRRKTRDASSPQQE